MGRVRAGSVCSTSYFFGPTYSGSARFALIWMEFICSFRKFAPGVGTEGGSSISGLSDAKYSNSTSSASSSLLLASRSSRRGRCASSSLSPKYSL